MATWPTLPDLEDQLSTIAPGGLDGVKAMLGQAALAAATEWIAHRCGLVPEVGEVPAPVRQAILLYAAKFYRRKDTPDGVAGSPENGIVRTGRYDSDAESLLHDFLAVPGLA